MSKTSKKININDIAFAAGVSKTTVSRYLNGHTELMSDKTRERIKSIIELSNYHPSDTARNLKLRHTNLIGVIVADMISPFSASLIAAISEYLTERGFIPLFANSNNSCQREKDLVNMLLSKDVAGFIINTTSFVNPDVIYAACSGVPIVLCDRYIDNYRFNIVTVDNRSALYNLVEHVRTQGYTRPALFTQNLENNSSRIRNRDAFLSAVGSLYGHDATEDVYVLEKADVSSAAVQLDLFKQKLKADDIPVIIGTNSITTVVTYKAMRNAGLVIPEDMGICGPEDWDWAADMLWPILVEPNITTFSIPTKEMGRCCAGLLLSLLKEQGDQPQEILLPTELRIRESTCRSGR